LCDGALMANFWRIFVSCIFSERVQHISDLHSKFALRPHRVRKYGSQSSLRPLRLGEEKERKKKKKKKKIHVETTGAKYNGLSYWAAIINYRLGG